MFQQLIEIIQSIKDKVIIRKIPEKDLIIIKLFKKISKLKIIPLTEVKAKPESIKIIGKRPRFPSPVRLPETDIKIEKTNAYYFKSILELLQIKRWDGKLDESPHLLFKNYFDKGMGKSFIEIYYLDDYNSTRAGLIQYAFNYIIKNPFEIFMFRLNPIVEILRVTKEFKNQTLDFLFYPSNFKIIKKDKKLPLIEYNLKYQETGGWEHNIQRFQSLKTLIYSNKIKITKENLDKLFDLYASFVKSIQKRASLKKMISGNLIITIVEKGIKFEFEFIEKEERWKSKVKHFSYLMRNRDIIFDSKKVATIFTLNIKWFYLIITLIEKLKNNDIISIRIDNKNPIEFSSRLTDDSNFLFYFVDETKRREW